MANIGKKYHFQTPKRHKNGINHIFTLKNGGGGGSRTPVLW